MSTLQIATRLNDSMIHQDSQAINKQVYIACNEVQQENTIQQLSEKPQMPNGVHIGWACEMNYKILVARRPKYALICDIDPNMHRILASIRHLMLEHESVEEFRTHFKNYIADKNVICITTRNLSPSQLVSHLSRPQGFLHDQNSYQFIREMYKTDRIMHLNLDITENEAAFHAIKRQIQEINGVVDTVYASNIVAWLDSDSQAIYRRNLSILHDQNTTSFIYAKRLEQGTQPSQILTSEIPREYISSPRRPRQSRPIFRGMAPKKLFA